MEIQLGTAGLLYLQMDCKNTSGFFLSHSRLLRERGSCRTNENSGKSPRSTERLGKEGKHQSISEDRLPLGAGSQGVHKFTAEGRQHRVGWKHYHLRQGWILLNEKQLPSEDFREVSAPVGARMHHDAHRGSKSAFLAFKLEEGKLFLPESPRWDTELCPLRLVVDCSAPRLHCFQCPLFSFVTCLK